MAFWYEEVLPLEFYRELHLIHLYAVKLPSNLCSLAIRIVGQCPELKKKYPHLKRVKTVGITPLDEDINFYDDNNKCHILLLLGDKMNALKRIHMLQQSGIIEQQGDTNNDNDNKFLISVQVPEYAPMNRKVCAQWNQYWPSTFRQPSWSPLIFKNNEAAKFTIYKYLDQLNQNLNINQYPWCATSCIITLGQRALAEAIIINNNNINQERSSSLKQTDHFLKTNHAPLQVLDILAQRILSFENIETLDTITEKTATSTKKEQSIKNCSMKNMHCDDLILFDNYNNNSNVTENVVTATNCNNNNNNKSVIKESEMIHDHGKKRALSSTFITVPSNNNNDMIEMSKEGNVYDTMFLSDDIPFTSLQYYATNCIAYCSAEPCIMCCMALLHSRVAAVVFPKTYTNTHFGGFGGRLSLHTDSRLNHNFRVLRIS